MEETVSEAAAINCDTPMVRQPMQQLTITITSDAAALTFKAFPRLGFNDGQ